MSLVRMNHVIGAYRSVPIAAGVIDRVRRDLAHGPGQAGVKMIPRFAYNFGPIGAADGAAGADPGPYRAASPRAPRATPT